MDAGAELETAKPTRHRDAEARPAASQGQARAPGAAQPSSQAALAGLCGRTDQRRLAEMAAALNGGRAALSAPAPLQRLPDAPVPSSSMPVQRVVMVVTMPDVEVEKATQPDFLTGEGVPKDMGVVNRAMALAKGKGTSAVPIEKADLAGLGNDMLYIYGHGTNQGKGDMALSASALAKLLKARGLKANSSITLMGCGSGKGYAADVEKALQSEGVACKEITAGLEATTTDSSGNNFVLSEKAKSDIVSAKLQVKPPDDPFDPLEKERYAQDLRKAEQSVTSKNAAVSSKQGVAKSLAPDIWVSLDSNAQVIKQGVPKVKEQPDFLTF